MLHTPSESVTSVLKDVEEVITGSDRSSLELLRCLRAGLRVGDNRVCDPPTEATASQTKQRGNAQDCNPRQAPEEDSRHRPRRCRIDRHDKREETDDATEESGAKSSCT